MSAVARVVEFTGKRPGRQVWTWCPGCESVHPFTIEAPPGEDGERLNSGTTWEWDGNLEAPTFSPSLLVHSSVHRCEGEHDPRPCTDPACSESSHAIGYVVAGELRWRFPEGPPEDAERVYGHGGGDHTRPDPFGPCHSFLRAGVWEFLSDSAHKLAGQRVPMVPIPEGWYSG